MKSNKRGANVFFLIVGLLICAAGPLLLWFAPAEEGLLEGLPYICIGVGVGVFGGNLGALLAYRKPEAMKQTEIERKDERNQALANKAKAKAFNVMLYVVAAVNIAFALMQVEAYVVLTLTGIYLFLIGVMIYYLNKYHKEM